MWEILQAVVIRLNNKSNILTVPNIQILKKKRLNKSKILVQIMNFLLKIFLGIIKQ